MKANAIHDRRRFVIVENVSLVIHLLKIDLHPNSLAFGQYKTTLTVWLDTTQSGNEIR